MVTVSLCMIVKNEETTLERCLSSVIDIADEIIIVDTGSTDATKQIGQKFTNKIYDFKWIDDFSAARNFSFEHAEMDYILWLDADDVILPEDGEKLKKMKQTLSKSVDVVMMKYNTGFDTHGNVTFSYFRERLVKNSRGFKWKEPVHEYLSIYGNIINSDICVTHKKHYTGEISRNVEIYENLLAKGNTLSARGMYYYARELKDNKRYKDAITWFETFLDTGKGWVEDSIAACGELARCYMAEDMPKQAFTAMLASFGYDTPRAEICCQIGYYFKDQKNYKSAAFWFSQALSCEIPGNSWGFTQEDCRGFIPSIECAVCYDHLGEHKKAKLYNDMAAEFKPDSPAVIQNKIYFDNIILRKAH